MRLLLLVVLLGQVVSPPPIDPETAIGVEMTLTAVPRGFTARELGRPLEDLVSAYCEGHLVAGPYRFTTTMAMPSALEGELVPAVYPPLEAARPVSAYDPDATLEPDGQTLVLWDVRQVRGFRAVSASSNPASISWACQVF